MVNKITYKPSHKDIMDNHYEMFRDKNQANKKDFVDSPYSPDHSDQESDTTEIGDLDLGTIPTERDMCGAYDVT